jgi:hypothetical protein
MEDEAELTGTTPRRRPKADILEIGGRRLKPATLMMGHGFDPALSEGSLKPPIFLTSTFVFENAAAGKRHFEGVTGKRPGGADGLIYSRFNGPNQEILEDRLAVWEDAEDALSSPPACRRSPPADDLRPARRRRRSFRPALRGDRNADRPDPRPVRRTLARLSGRRHRGEIAGGLDARRPWAVSRSSISKARQPDQRFGRRPGGRRRARRPVR